MDYKRLMWEGHHYRFGLAGEGQADTIERYLDGKKGRVLNIGCGPWGDRIRNLAAHCKFQVAADISLKAMQRGYYKTSCLLTDARNLALANNYFDHVLALGLFAEIRNPRPVFAELYRVCRRRGHLMMTNAVRHPKRRYIKAASAVGFKLVEEQQGHCPAASGDIKERYLLVFQKHKPDE